jgi:DNA polymerase I-like protein with 3'-5' exonuclease and polymerase domains
MYENVRTSKVISVDIETYDPELITMGPGVYRSVPLNFTNANGYILGVSLVDEHGNKGYYDLGHYDCTLELRAKNMEYLKESLETDAIKIGANLLYDLDWLENWAMIPVNGPLIDIQIAEALIDENQRHYNLDFIGKKYFGEGKSKKKLEDFCYNNGLKGDVRKHLWKMPWYLVEEYAIQDVDLPMKIWQAQEPIIIEEGLTDLMFLECELLRMLLLMRKTGVKIDTVAREKNAYELTNRVEETHLKLTKQVGFDFNFRSTKHLAFILDEHGIPYPLTDKGNPSVTRETLIRLSKGQLEGLDGEKVVDEVKVKLGTDLADLRRADKVLKTFVHGSLVKFVTEGDLIHGSFHSMLTDKFGTRSGRFSSAHPNLQQIPSIGVDEYYGRLSREPFIPLEDHMWGKLDYSQIEYRFMAHFARGEGAEEVRAQYNFNPRTDYHQYIQDLTGLKRRYAKNLNFGVAYGMGAKHMSEFFQWDMDYCYQILNTYHSSAPFIKSTIREVEHISKRRGYIKTFLNRRSRLLDPNKAYIMFCRLTQGSAADLMKKSLYDIYRAGIFDVLPPHLTVHDEVDVSVPRTKEGAEAFLEAKNIMENCIKLRVPIIADMEIGNNWADIKDVEDKEHLYKILGVK